MRPDLAAFRELDTLVRNLSDQLAGYRRRALAAESRSRELEQATDAMRSATSAAHDRAEALSEELAGVSRALSAERLAHVRAQAAIQELTQKVAEAALEPGENEPASPSERALARENAELQRRLEEAGVKTRELSERLRFLRQQLSTVPEK